MKSKFVSILILLLSGLCVASARSKAPNILLMVADDLGFSDLGCYGGEIDTPNLDGLAANGIRLTQFYNTGRCCSSRASILTGMYPHRVGLGHMTQDIGRFGYRGRVSANAVTLAEVLKTEGYRTFLSGKWHLGTEDPTQHGFEEFYGTLVSAKTFWDKDHFIRLPKGRQARRYTDDEFYGTDALVDHAEDFLGMARETPGKPWFLYLAFNAPHFPLHAPKEDIEKYKDRYAGGWDKLREERLLKAKELGIVAGHTQVPPRSPWWNYGETESGLNPAWDSLPSDRQKDLARRMAIYAAMVDRMDQNIGRLLENLRSNGELENTFILFTSDNGACAEWDPRGFDGKSSNDNILHQGAELDRMGSRGTYHSAGSGWANASNTPWRLYKHFNHEGGISSPGIISWPELSKMNGEIVHHPTHVIDIMPTLLQVSGAKYPKRLDGRPIMPKQGVCLIKTVKSRRGSRELFFEHEGNRAMRDDEWKLVALKGRPWELYNIEEDRNELNNLAAEEKRRVRRMEKKWLEWAEENFVATEPIDLEVQYLKPPGN